MREGNFCFPSDPHATCARCPESEPSKSEGKAERGPPPGLRVAEGSREPSGIAAALGTAGSRPGTRLSPSPPRPTCASPSEGLPPRGAAPAPGEPRAGSPSSTATPGAVPTSRTFKGRGMRPQTGDSPRLSPAPPAPSGHVGARRYLGSGRPRANAAARPRRFPGLFQVNPDKAGRL